MTQWDGQTIREAVGLLNKESPNGPGLITYTRAERQKLIEAFVAMRNEVELWQVKHMSGALAGEQSIQAWHEFQDLFSKESKEAGQDRAVRPQVASL